MRWQAGRCDSRAGVADRGVGCAATRDRCGTPRQQVSAQSKCGHEYDGSSDDPASICSRLFSCDRHRCCLMSRLEKLLRYFGIAEFFSVKIHHRYMRTVFHFRLTQVVQMLFPVAEVFQVFGDVLGKQDVLGITTIHHPLGNVDAGTGNVGPTAHIHHPAHRPAVHAHAQLELGMFPCRAADLQGAFHRRFRGVVKHQCHPIAGRNGNQPMVCFGFSELFGARGQSDSATRVSDAADQSAAWSSRQCR